MKKPYLALSYTHQWYPMLQKADHQFYHHPVQMNVISGAQLHEEHFQKQMPYGVLEFSQWCFDGLRIRHTRNHFHDKYLFENRNEQDMVGLEFNLKGNYEIHHIGHTYQVSSRRHNIIYSPQVHNTFYNMELRGETFVIQFMPDIFLNIVKDSNDTLRRFADAVAEGRTAVIAQVSPLLTPELHRAIMAILNCRYTGGLKKIFLFSKCMEILVLQAEAFDQAVRPHKEQKQGSDKDPIVQACEYLEKHIHQPPSLSELSKIVGINEYKLKKGFKEVYKTTVFGYLSDHRLELARKALLSRDKSISEIAYELGYSSPQHFSAAFRKKFGFPPKGIYGHM